MNVYKYLPFMNDEDLEELATKILSGDIKEVPLYKLYPFLSKSRLDQIVKEIIEKNDQDSLKHALPFVSKESLTFIREKIKEGALDGFDETHLLPFLDPEEVKRLFYDKLEEYRKKDN